MGTLLVPDNDRWKSATWNGNRREQHVRFFSLPLAEKLELIEQMAEVAALVSKGPSTTSVKRVTRGPGE